MAAVPVEVVPEDQNLDRSTPSDLLGAMTMGDSPSLLSFSEEALKEARELKTLDISAGSGAGDPFRDCFTRVDDGSDIDDASLLLEEAQCFITRDEAIKDLQADLAKVREEEAELDKQETLDRLAAEKETILTKLLSANVQIRSVKKKGSVQAKKIEELEKGIAEAKAEVESSKVLADKSIVVYRADAEAAQMEARAAAKVADTRAHWIAELAKYRSRRETLEEIHARGFDLTEEVKKAKQLEAEAEALASDDDDDDDGSESGSEDGEELDQEA
ncbi:uncharacterized protein [Nicotiana tomentosiformis]|uniref:uncharacterized protein n=1 Tax=Nicotiana tomentosiformis TaxID=4098 RepID=UPI00388CDDB0